MSQRRTAADLEAELGLLRASAERAGAALACPFSCSDEFEAAVIRARRVQPRAGIVRSAPRRLLAAAIALAIGLGLIAALM